MDELQAGQGLIDRVQEPLVAKLREARRVLMDGSSALVEVLRPLSSFFGLEPVLVTSQLDEPSLFEELLENTRHFPAQPLAVGREVLDEQVGDHRGCRSESRVADAFVRELADQEDERAERVP